MVIDSRTPNTGCYRYLHSEEQTVHPFAVFFRTCYVQETAHSRTNAPEPLSKYLRVSHKPEPANQELFLASKDRAKKKAKIRNFPSLSEGTVQVSLIPSPHIVLTPEATVLPGDCASDFMFCSMTFSSAKREHWPSLYPSPSCCSFPKNFSLLSIQGQCLRAIFFYF